MSSMPEVMDSPLVVADKWVEVQQLDSAQRQAEADLAAMLRVQNLPIAAWRTDRAGLRPPPLRRRLPRPLPLDE
jgi:hypothetical protein